MGAWISEGQGAYQILVSKEARKFLQKLPKNLLGRISKAIDGLAGNPRPEGCKKLEGYDNLYRIRVGDWRISYAIEDDRLIVLVIEVAPKSDAKRKL
jgi:mRNA interferase RelE/StbE